MIRHLLRTVLLSAELLSLLACFGLSFLFPDLFQRIDRMMFEQQNAGLSVALYVGLFSISLAPTFVMGMRVLFPKETNRRLLNWPNYRMLKASVLVGVVWQGSAVLAFVVLSLYRADIPELYRFTVPIYVSTFSCMASFVLAYVSIRSIIERHE